MDKPNQLTGCTSKADCELTYCEYGFEFMSYIRNLRAFVHAVPLQIITDNNYSIFSNRQILKWPFAVHIFVLRLVVLFYNPFFIFIVH
jgi:hypothetical protein